MNASGATPMLVDDVIAFCRMFAVMERDHVCCGSVTVAQCVVLQTLLDGTWDVSSLAAHTHVTKGAMTRLIDGLERRGFAERQADEDDGRRWQIVLTKHGRKEAKRLQSLTENAMALIMSRVPKELRAQTMESIAALRKAVEEVRSDLECC